MTETRIIIDLAATGDLEKANQELLKMVTSLKKVDSIFEEFSKANQQITRELAATAQQIEKIEKSSTKRGQTELKQISELQKKRKELNGELENNRKAEATFAKAREDANAKTIGLVEKQKAELKKLKEELQKTNDPQQIKKLNIEIEESALAFREAKNEAKALAQENRATAGSYDALVAENKRLVQEMRKLPLDDTSGKLAGLQSKINENTQALKAADEAIGRNFRNVGNYEEAIKNAAGRVNIFGVNLGEVNEQFRQGASDASKLAKNILGVNQSLTATQRGLKLVKVALASTGIGAVVVALGSLIAFLTKSQEGLDLVNTVLARVTATANVLLDRGIKIGKALTNIFNQPFAQTLDDIKEGFSGIADEMEREVEAAVALEKARQKLERREINQLAVSKQLIEVEERLKNVRDDERQSIERRVQANEALFSVEQNRLKLLEQNARERIRLLNEEINLRGGIQAATNTQLRELREAELELADIREESVGRENEFILNRFQLQKELLERELELTEAQVNQRIARAKKGSQEEFDLRKKLIEERTALELEAAQFNPELQQVIQERARAEFETLKQEFETLFALDPIEIPLKVNPEKTGLFKDVFKGEDLDPTKELDEITDRTAKRLDRYIEVVTQKYDNLKKIREHQELERKDIVLAIQESLIVSSLIFADTFINNRLQKFDREFEALEAQKDRELAVVADNEQAKASIEERFAQKSKQLRREEAEAEKRLRIFQSIINTLAAVTAFLAQGRAAAAIAAGITGTAQTLAITATPIPQFFKGVERAPKGPAWVGEKGWEFIESGNKMYKTNDGPQLVYLKGGETIHPHEKSVQMFKQSPEIFTRSLAINNQSVRKHEELYSARQNHDRIDYERILQGIKKIVDERPVPGWSPSEHDLRKWVQRGNSRIEYINKKNKLG